MKLIDVLLLSMAVVSIVIGSYEVMAVGVGQAYVYLMATLVLLFAYLIRKGNKH
jgi:hypothetical protein